MDKRSYLLFLKVAICCLCLTSSEIMFGLPRLWLALHVYECPYSKKGELLAQGKHTGCNAYGGGNTYEGGIGEEKARNQLRTAYFDPLFYERVIVLKRNGSNAQQIMDDLVKNMYLIKADLVTSPVMGSNMPITNLLIIMVNHL